jgi:hypothetical protein
MATHGGLIIFHELHIAAPKNKRKNKKKPAFGHQSKGLFFFSNEYRTTSCSERTNERRQGFTNLISCLQPPGELKQ